VGRTAAPADLNGFTIEQLAALARLDDGQLTTLGQDVARVRNAAAKAVDAGMLPPF
jgi:hypothetical protein